MKASNKKNSLDQAKLYESDFANSYETIYSWEGRYWYERPFYQKLVKRHKIKRILDIGCGNGFHLYLFSSLANVEKVVGLDSSTLMIRKAVGNLSDNHIRNVNVLQGNILHLSKSITEKFHLITCIFTLSTLASKKKVIRALKGIRKFLSPNGVLVIEDPDGDRISKYKPALEYKQIEVKSFRLMERSWFCIEIYNYLIFPLLITLRQHKINIKIALPPLYRWLHNRNLYMRIYHTFKDYLFSDHIFLQSGIRRFNVQHYQTIGLLLTKERLSLCLKKAGFKKVTFIRKNIPVFKLNFVSYLVTAQ